MIKKNDSTKSEFLVPALFLGMHALTHTYTHACTHAHTHTCTHTHMHTHIHTYICMHTHRHAHTLWIKVMCVVYCSGQSKQCVNLNDQHGIHDNETLTTGQPYFQRCGPAQWYLHSHQRWDRSRGCYHLKSHPDMIFAVDWALKIIIYPSTTWKWCRWWKEYL